MPILFPNDPMTPATAGGKACALAALGRAGFDVPPWFVVTPDELVPTPRLAEAVGRLGAGPFAVRSSAASEDGDQHSFAGQFDTFLDVGTDQVADAIRSVRASSASEHVRAYQAARGGESVPVPAAIVQSMVTPRAAGVAFSADPVSGRRSVTVVSAVPGLGEALVSGASDADTWEVRADGPARQTARRPGGGPPCLDDGAVMLAAALARRCERHFGRPQDIEWALDHEGRLFLLQSRPITTLGARPDPDDTLRVWDNSNIAESYGGVTTPLTFTFARRAYENVYREFCRLFRVPAARLARSEAVFPVMLGLVRGRVYYNLLSWYRVLALLPGFALNRRFMEQMMGVKEALPEELVQNVVRENRTSAFADTMALLGTLAGMVGQALTLPRRMRAFRRRLDEALRPGPPLETMRAEELAEAYRTLEAKLLRHWDAPLVNDFFAMMAYGLLRALCRKWAGDESGSAQNDLLVGQGGIISAEPAREIAAMSAQLVPVEAEVLVSAEVPVEDKLHLVRGKTDLADRFQRYLDRFGDRCLEELKLESPTLRDDPSSLLTAIGGLALRRAETPPCAAPPAHGPSPMATLAARIRNPLKRWLFKRVATLAGRRVRDRENLRFERTRLFGRVRGLLRALGNRLAADGVLDRGDDVFSLELDEILGLFDGTSASLALRETVAARRAEFDRYRAEPPPPDRFQTRGPLHRQVRFESLLVRKSDPPSGPSRTGLGASPGLVSGRVRVVIDPRRAGLQPGEILVARQTDPGWVMLFPVASGLLVERGSLLSHSAIVSRELGLPCVVSLAGLCEWLRDGDEVRLDGTTGEVTLLNR